MALNSVGFFFFFVFRREYIHNLGILYWPIAQRFKRLPGINGEERRRPSHRSRIWLSCPVTWTTQTIKSSGVRDIHWTKYIILCSWEATKDSSGIWRNAILSVAVNYSPCEKQLLALSSHLVETKAWPWEIKCLCN